MQDKAVINRMLSSSGYPTLDDPTALCSQLGGMVRDHEHFRSLLAHAEPETRRDMYDALTPNLRFKPKPLDVYMSEAGDIADREQQPRWAGDHFEPYMTAEIRTTNTVQVLVEQAAAKVRLDLVCRKCTRGASFYGPTKYDAVRSARDAGWTYDEITGTGREICPECP
jgi:hypothetical protein